MAIVGQNGYQQINALQIDRLALTLQTGVIKIDGEEILVILNPIRKVTEGFGITFQNPDDQLSSDRSTEVGIGDIAQVLGPRHD